MKLKLVFDDEARDKWNVRLFVSIILLKLTNLTFSTTDMIPDLMEWIVLLMIGGLFVISLIYNILADYRKVSLTVLFISVCMILMYLSAYIKYPSISEDIDKRFFSTIAICLPCLWSASKITNAKYFFKSIKPYSYYMTLLGSMIFFGDTVKLSSNMNFSGAMLFPFCLHFYYALKKNRIDLIVSLYELSIIFIHGSRGAMIYIPLFVFLYFFMKGLRSFKVLQKILLAIPIISTVLFIVVSNLSNIAGWFTVNFGYIRNLDYLVSGLFFSGNGRDDIREKYLDMIFNSSPIMFRVIDLHDYNSVTYPHNVFIEILYNYGYLLGGTIIVMIFLWVIRGMIKFKRERYDLHMILLCSGLFPLLTSFTYLEWPLFWGLIGYLVLQIKRCACR